MKNSIFCSTAPIGLGHGGGIVSYYEVMALKETTDLVKILCPKSEIEGSQVISMNGHYPGNPFMYDYLCSLNSCHADIVFFNGAPFGSTVKSINPSRVIVDVPAHDLELSIDEHKRLLGNYPYKNMTDPFLKSMYLDFIVNADIIICPSKASADYVKKDPGTKGKVVIIPHGCDLPETTTLPEQFKIGYLGAVGPDKGLIYLLRAWAGLMYQDSELLLRTDPIPNEWMKLFAKGQKVTRSDYVKELSDFYNQISIYVQPSVTEAFGIPVLEAMSHGRPVIVTEGAGSSELIQDGVEGFVVTIRRPDLIADRIDYLKSNPDRVVEMGKKARLKAEQYSWTKALNNLKGVINE